MLIKQTPDLFILEVSDGNFFLRVDDEDAMREEIDMWFSFPSILSDKEIKDLFSLLDIKIKII